MPKTATPASIQLPPVRVEPRLHEALVAIAEREGRTITDLMRGYLRTAVANDKRRSQSD